MKQYIQSEQSILFSDQQNFMQITVTQCIFGIFYPNTPQYRATIFFDLLNKMMLFLYVYFFLTENCTINKLPVVRN